MSNGHHNVFKLISLYASFYPWSNYHQGQMNARSFFWRAQGVCLRDGKGELASEVSLRNLLEITQKVMFWALSLLKAAVPPWTPCRVPMSAPRAHDTTMGDHSLRCGRRQPVSGHSGLWKESPSRFKWIRFRKKIRYLKMEEKGYEKG